MSINTERPPITQNQIFERMGVLKDKLYHSGNNYIATIKVEKGGWSWIEKVVPEDNMKELIGNLGAILAIIGVLHLFSFKTPIFTSYEMKSPINNSSLFFVSCFSWIHIFLVFRKHP
jgi:uncharacterized protein YrrD